MSIFGQVWVYSAAAFVLGALLSWLFLARPARRSVRELRRRLAQSQSAPPARPAQPDRGYEATTTGGGGGRSEGDPVAAMPSTRYIEPLPQPGQGEVTQHIPAATNWPEQDSLRAYRSPEPPAVPADPSSAEPAFDTTAAASLGSVLEPEPASGEEPPRQEGHVPAEPEEPPAPARVASLFQPASADDEREDFGDGLDTEQPPAYAFGDRDTPADDEAPVEQTQVLPKRQPRQALRGGFEPPKPIQPSLRPIARREPESEAAGGHSGSLFEPTVAPKDAAPSAREKQEPQESPSGPFGPGSAMPRPGGGRPSDDFTVKASVTALRYCTEDSPQFSRMVAEVWFRTPADAERVGFRPLG